MKDLLGYDVEEIVGAEIFSFMAEEEQASNKSFFKRMREMPAPFSGRHVTQIRKDGRRVIIEINGAPIYTKDGELSGFCGCDKDITRKVEAEDILRESEERYRNLFENTQAGVFRATLDGMQFLDVNRKFAEIFGFSTEEILNQPSPFNFSHSKEMIQMVHQVNKEGTAENHEIEAMTQDGRKITCLASVKYFPRQKYVEGTIVDISDRKKMEVALREREKELDNKNERLREMNSALRVLLKKRDEDKEELEEKVLLNVQRLITPFMDKLKTCGLDEKQASLVDILEANVKDIVSPFSKRLSSHFLKLTPAEMQISNLIRHGKSTKDIAELLTLSITTIETHRRNIRKKIGLTDRKQNLRTYLSDLPNE